MIKNILITLLSFLIYPTYSQNIDSIKAVAFNSTLSVNIRVEALTFLTDKFERTEPDSALLYLNQLLHLHKYSNNYSDQGNWLNTKAGIHIIRQHYDMADTVLQVIQQFIDEKKIIPTSDILLNMGSLALSQGKLDSALVHYLKGLDLISDTTEKGSRLKFYNNIAVIYMQLRQPKKAQEYLELAVEAHDQNDPLKLNLLSNLGSLYQNNKEYRKAEATLKKAEKLGLEIDDQRVLATTYSNLSAAYQELNNLEASISYGLKGLALKRSGGFGGEQFALNNLGYTYILKKDYTNAAKYLNEALVLASGEEKMQILLNLKNANNALGNHTLALEQLELYNHLKDSLNALAYDSRVAEINEKYQNEKKEKEIALLSSENQLQKSTLQKQQYIMITVVVFSTLLLFIGYLLYHQSKIKQDLEEALIQQKFLRIQLNPHFLFNALTGIQHFLFENKPEKSIEYLSHFSTLMREVLETSDQDWVPLDREIKLLSSYLKLQQINHPSPFEYNITLEEGLKQDQIMIPTMLIQPFIENAVVHGLKNVDNGLISLSIMTIGKKLAIAIADNGYGINNTDSKADSGMYRSMSSDIISKRIALLKKKFSTAASLNISKADVSVDRPGTKVTIEIPLVYDTMS